MWGEFSESMRNMLYNLQSVIDHSNKKERTFKSRGHTFTSNSDISIDVNDCEVHICPIGQKTTKRNDKFKVRESDKMKQINDTN